MGLHVFWGDGKIPKLQPAYPMEEQANIFGERIQLPQRHGLSSTEKNIIKTGDGK